MAKQGKGPIVWILLAAVCFVVAALAGAGMILRSDSIGRLIYGVLWSLIGVSWLGRYFIARRREQLQRQPTESAG